MSVTVIRRWGKARRLRSMADMKHMPTVRGQGRWESKACLWRHKRKARRKRLIANASRRQNRAL